MVFLTLFFHGFWITFFHGFDCMWGPRLKTDMCGMHTFLWLYSSVWMFVHVCMCVCVCMRVYVCVCVLSVRTTEVKMCFSVHLATQCNYLHIRDAKSKDRSSVYSRIFLLLRMYFSYQFFFAFFPHYLYSYLQHTSTVRMI